MSRRQILYTCPTCKKDFKPKSSGDCFCPECYPTEKPKLTAAFKNMSDEAALSISGAIIKAFCDDYVAEVDRWKKAYESNKKKTHFNKLKMYSRYFKSKDFAMLSLDLNGKKLQKDINKIIYSK